MRVAVVLSEHDMLEWRSAHGLGTRPSALPYGVDALEDAGVRLTWPARSCGRAGKLRRKVRRMFERRSGLVLEHPIRTIVEARKADLVVTLLEPHAALPAAFKARGLPPFSSMPLITLSCWTAEEARMATAEGRQQLLAKIAPIDLLIYWSETQTPILIDLGVDRNRLGCVPYGIDADFYIPADAPQDFDVLAVGQDHGRDYGTLFEAVRGRDVQIDVVCRPGNLVGLEVPENVRLHEGVDHCTYRDMLRRARVVVVPTHEVAYPTGQSVVLEASACGRCVVVTRTPAMSEYVEHDRTALLCPPHDPSALWEQLERALSDEALRREVGGRAGAAVRANFTTQLMWSRILDLARQRGIEI